MEPLSNVRNLTIGSPSQPGKLVILNGQIDVYDAAGYAEIASGAVQTGILAYATDNTYPDATITGVGYIVPGLCNVSYTVPATSRMLRVYTRIGWKSNTVGGGTIQINIINEDGVTLDTTTFAQSVDFVSETASSLTYIQNPAAGDHRLTVSLNTQGTTAAYTTIAGYGPGILAIELV